MPADPLGRAGAEPLVLGAFLAGSVLAGGNAVAVRYSNRELDPLWGAGLRFGLAALVLGGLMFALRLAVPRGRDLSAALAYGVLSFGVGFGLFYYALQEVHAGLGQVILALVPLATLALAVAQGQESLQARAVVGGVVALAGIAVVSQEPLREAVPLGSLLAALGCVLCFAQAGIVIRGRPGVHALSVNALGMGFGAVILVGAALVAGESVRMPERAETVRAIVFVVLVGSVLVFSLYLWVLARWSASRTAYQFVLIPISTLALSAWLDDEEIGSSLIAGALLVMAGVYIGALAPARDDAA